MKDYSYINESTPVKELPSTWPVLYDQINFIAEQVFPYHSHLERKSIIFLFKKSMTPNGTAQICSKQINAILSIYDTEVDFIICLNWQIWNVLNIKQKAALVDHELEHCKYDEDDRPIMIDHDIEEFTCIVERHGLWTTGLQRMEQTMKRRRPIKTSNNSVVLSAVQ